MFVVNRGLQQIGVCGMGILFVHIMYIEHNLGKEYGRGKLRFAVNQGEVNQGKLVYIMITVLKNKLK